MMVVEGRLERYVLASASDFRKDVHRRSNAWADCCLTSTVFKRHSTPAT